MPTNTVSTPPPGLDPVDYIEQTRADYEHLGFEAYRWAHNPDTVPLSPLQKPLSASRLGIIASGGIYVRGQVAFHFKDDTSYRRVPIDTGQQDLRVSHFAYDVSDARRDTNVVLPLHALKKMMVEGVIGSLATHALTFMGGIYSQRRVREELIPALDDELRDQRADIALLVPV